MNLLQQDMLLAAGPAPATQISQPCLVDPVGTAYTEDLIPDLTTQKPPPRTVTLSVTFMQPKQVNQTFDKGRKIRGISQLYFSCF